MNDPVAEEEEYDDIGSSPEHPGRSRFNMTNIVEESRWYISPTSFVALQLKLMDVSHHTLF